ncbi:MAG: hypothetical protein ABSH19_01075 [Opitutales bacterium]|jgi:hypothetical protein
MKTTPLPLNAAIASSTSIVTVTRKMMRERAVMLAVVVGRSVHEVSKSDWQQAKREMMIVSEAQAEEAVPESEGWAPAPGSTGHKVPVPSGDDEDDEGRSDTERLVIEGAREAGREQRREADREAEKDE